MDQVPTFIIAGAMRSGTTSLNGYLREHPQIAMSQPKEVHFFDRHFDKGLEWYGTHFPGAAGATAVGEATPEYLYDPSAVERIAATIPDVKLVVMLRNPIERAYSHYWHNRSRGRETLAFEAALDAEAMRIASEPAMRPVFSYIDKGRYRHQIERVYRFFGTDQVLIQTFEELQEHPDLVFARTCRFVGVNEDFRPSSLGRAINAYVEFRSPRLRDTARRFPPPVRRLVGRLNQRSTSGYPPMRRETRRRLSETFAEANEGLSELVGFEATAWV